MADHGGLSMALEAYTTWRRTNMDVRLPALPFDDMQLFFLGICVVTSIHTKINKMRQLARKMVAGLLWADITKNTILSQL